MCNGSPVPTLVPCSAKRVLFLILIIIVIIIEFEFDYDYDYDWFPMRNGHYRYASTKRGRSKNSPNRFD